MTSLCSRKNSNGQGLFPSTWLFRRVQPRVRLQVRVQLHSQNTPKTQGNLGVRFAASSGKHVFSPRVTQPGAQNSALSMLTRCSIIHSVSGIGKSDEHIYPHPVWHRPSLGLGSSLLGGSAHILYANNSFVGLSKEAYLRNFRQMNEIIE